MLSNGSVALDNLACSQMTSILIDARLGWGSGIGRYVANNVPLVAQRMPDVTFDLLVGEDDRAAAQKVASLASNVRPVISPLRAFSLAEQLRLPGLASGYDLTWFTNYWVPLAFRAPFVVAVHDMIHLEPNLFPASPAKRLLSQLTFRHVAARAKGIGFGSRFTQREFERRFDTRARSIVTGYGIDHAGYELFDPAQQPDKKSHLLIVAAAKKHKNFKIAIEAFADAKIASHWQLTIITPNDNLRSSIDLEGMSMAARNVVFKQGVSNSELRTIYGETAILLMPSLYEGFGLPLAEGLQAGAVCIASTAQSLVELGQGAEVTFVNSNDLQGWVQAIETECARFDAGQVSPAARAANMRHSMKFNWAGVADRTAEMLTDVLSSARQ